MAFPCKSPKFIFNGKEHTAEELTVALKKADLTKMATFVPDVKAMPAMPLEKSWHELAMKRVLRMAAEQGYDAVSWDTGETSADRYSLAKAVTSIEVYPKTNGNRMVDVSLQAHHDRPMRLEVDPEGTIIDSVGAGLGGNDTNLKGKNLGDVVGKDLAVKLMTATDYTKIEGEGLKIGGEGMVGFYDRILPAFVNKYTKKWGGKVEPSRVVTEEGNSKGTWAFRDGRIEETKHGDFDLYGTRKDTGEEVYLQNYDTRAEAEHELKLMQGGDTTVPVHSLAITPSMKESVLTQGQSRFQLEGVSDADLKHAELLYKELDKPDFETFAKEFKTDIPDATASEIKAAYKVVAPPETAPKPEPIPDRITSTKNATVTAERAERGLSPVEREGKREFGTVWDEAQNETRSNPDAGANLVKTLLNHPSQPITDTENALLLQRQVTLNNQHDDLARQLVKAFDDGDTIQAEVVRKHLAPVSDALDALNKVTTAAGTALGRGLNARRMMVKNDYSLQRLELRKRAAMGGRELTDAERSDLVKQVDELKARQAELEAHIDAQSAEIATANAKMPSPAVLELANRVVNRLHERRDAARAVLAKRGDIFGVKSTTGSDMKVKHQLEDKQTDAAREKWLGKSVVRDEVYHGQVAANQEIDSFRPGYWPKAIWLTSDASLASDHAVHFGSRAARGESGPVYPVHIRVTNPLEIDAKGEDWMNVPVPKDIADEYGSDTQSTDALVDLAQERGHDGLIVRNVQEGHSFSGKPATIYAVFDPKNIKSRFNRGTYDDSGDILHQLDDELDPIAVKALAEIGASHIADVGLDYGKWGEAMKGEFGDKIEPYLKDLYDASTKQFDKHAKTVSGVKESIVTKVDTVDGLTAKIRTRMTASDDISPLVQRLAKKFVAEGVTDRRVLIDKVHAVLKDIDPETTRRDAMDAISGYGKYKTLSKDAVDVTLRDLKGQMQQIAKLEDMASGKAPAKTGMERRAVTDEERALIKQVEEKKKEGGYSVTDPETQLKTALGTAKTRLENSIRDTEREIATRTRIVPKKSDPVTSPEIEALKTRLADLREQHAQIFGKPGLSDAQRVKIATKAAEASIADLERRIAEKDISPKTQKATPETPELKDLRQKRASLQKQLYDLRMSDPAYRLNVGLRAAKAGVERSIADLEKQISTRTKIIKNAKSVATDAQLEDLRMRRDELRKQFDEIFGKPEMTDAERLSAWKKRATKRLGELEQKLADGDFSKPPKRKPIADLFDAEGMKLNANVEAVKEKINNEIRREERKNRTTGQKVRDFLPAYGRAVKLSAVTVFGKLAAAAASRVPTNMAEQAIEHGYGKAFPKLANQMGREYGFRVKAEAKAMTNLFMEGMQDAYKTLKTGESDLSRTYGKRHGLEESLIQQLKDPKKAFANKGALAEAVMEFSGTLHQVMKSPIKRSQFARHYELGMMKELADGADVHDPIVQLRVGVRAYAAAERTIFMQDNFLSDWYKAGVRDLERRGKPKEQGGSGNVSAANVATILRMLLPIVKVPTNFVGETAKLAGGPLSVAVAGVKAINAHRHGIENLSADDAELIMRWAKKGTLGSVGMLIGGMFPAAFGGFYTGKRDEKDVKAGGLRIGGVNIPPALLHNPFLASMQVGATIRRVMDARVNAKSEEMKGLTAGVIAAGLGLLEEVPFLKQTVDIGSLFDEHKREGWFDRFIKGATIPAGLSQIAEYTDKDAQGNYIKRKPEGLTQTLESGIPGLRQNIPAENPPMSDEEKKLVQDAKVKHGKPSKVMDIIDEQIAQGEDAQELKDQLTEKIDRKVEKGTLTKSEAERANKLLGLEGDDAYEGQVEDPETPDFEEGAYGKNAKTFIEKVATWAEAAGTDPITAFKRFMGGEKIARLENGTIIVERNIDSDKERRRRGAPKSVTLDHIIPLELGGTNDQSNLELVDEDKAAEADIIENYLGRALHAKKVTGAKAQELMLAFKRGDITEDDVVVAVGVPLKR